MEKAKVKKQLTVELKFEREKEPEMGKSFKMCMKTEWLSSESKFGNFALLSTAGLGGSELYFKANGKTYTVDMAPVFRSLVEQIIN